jgi:hypothetical protein
MACYGVPYGVPYEQHIFVALHPGESRHATNPGRSLPYLHGCCAAFIDGVAGRPTRRTGMSGIDRARLSVSNWDHSNYPLVI